MSVPESARRSNTRFRLTHWPGAPTPIPKVTPWRVSLDEEGFIRSRGISEPVELPLEMYLREPQEVDLNVPESIGQFVEQWGPLSVQGRNPHELLAPAAVPSRNDAELKALVKKIRARKEYVQEPVTHVKLEAIHLRTIRALATHWASHKLDASDHVALVRSWIDQGFTEVQDAKAAWLHFENRLNWALHPVQVHVRLDPDRTALGLSIPTVYSAMCVQLANDIAREAEYHRCANEPCRRVFSRQRDRAEHGQHRTTNVQYCSFRCARAQAQRQYRRRKKQQKAGRS